MFALQLGSLQSSNFVIVFAAAVVVILFLLAIASALRRRRRKLTKSFVTGEKFSEKKRSSSGTYRGDSYAEISATGKFIEKRGTEFKVRSPQTTTIVKGNINVPTVNASQSQADNLHNELFHLSPNFALILNETVMDEETTTAKIYEVKKNLDSDVALSLILVSCIDIARSLNRASDAIWIERESFGAPEWRDSAIVDVTDSLVFPDYRLIDAKMYLNYKKEGESHPTIEEYNVPVFESRPVYLIENAVLDAQSQNADYIEFNAPAPLQCSSMASLGEFVPMAIDVRDYEIILKEIKRRIYDFITLIE
jgi:hypothetical protein